MTVQRPLLSRRTVLTGLGASSLWPATILAAPPHTLTFGAFEITVLSDGHLMVPTRFLARNVSQAEIMSASSAIACIRQHPPTV